MTSPNLLHESLLVPGLDAKLDIEHVSQDQDLSSKCVDKAGFCVHHGVVLVEPAAVSNK